MSEPVDGLNTDGLDDPTASLIRVVVDAALADVVSDRFWQVGVRGVTETTRDDGRVEVSSSVGDDPDAIARAVATFDADWDWTVDVVDAAPGDAWKQHARPTWFRPDRVLVPSWIDPADVDGADTASSVTVVDPESAFGLGDHPTTRSSMAMLAGELERRDRVDGVLDVGCGTGALAILAAQIGVERVRAIDVAHAAVAATRHNAVANGVADVVEVDATPLSEVTDAFDVVVANILAPVLLSIADDLRRVTSPDGVLIVSGLLDRRHQHVLAALSPMQTVDSLVDDGWITIALRHPSGR